ncbi:MAG: hypothetical protein IKN87_05435 [Bacilli bacterium]|nr:hypothetical protein [Bacilli bacterium]
MNNNMLEKHVINIMDCYCTYYDKKMETENGIVYESIFKNMDKINETLDKVIRLVCDELKIDYNSIDSSVVNRIKAYLYVKNQYEKMANQVVTMNATVNGNGKEIKKYIEQCNGLIRYLGVFFNSVHGKKPGENLTEEEENEFRKIYLECVVDGEFDKFLKSYNRYLELQEKVNNRTITPEETVEMDDIDDHIKELYANTDFKYSINYSCFDKYINKKSVVTDRSQLRFLFNRAFMRINSPISESSKYEVAIKNYAYDGDNVDLAKLDRIKSEVGLFYGRLALNGDNSSVSNVSLPLMVDKLDGDNLDIMMMLNTYFKMYNQGYEQYNYLTKKM